MSNQMHHETRPLWYLSEIADAVGGTLQFYEIASDMPVTGVSIDTRTLQEGDLFIAIKGPYHDGHDYLDAAFAAGAAAALVSSAPPPDKDYAPKTILVADTQTALEQLGAAARQRMKGKVIAVTGSVGKTSVKEGLLVAFGASAKAHASQASYNNLWGVPLSLARMPAETEFGVFEIGMNHAGEITPLSAQVKPDLAIITKIAPAHMESFKSLEEIAHAKSEIFSGLAGMKLALIPQESEWFELMKAAAIQAGAAQIFGFGTAKQADVRAEKIKLHPHCSCLEGSILGQELAIRVGLPGQHMAMNALTILGAVHLLGGDLALASIALGQMEALSGRGKRHHIHLPQGEVTLIDETYNANPESMSAALIMLGQMPRYGKARRIAVLADMKELGHDSAKLHRSLAQEIKNQDIDLVLTLGDDMANLHEALPPGHIGLHATSIEQIETALVQELQEGDIVMMKGSNAMGLSKLVDVLCAFKTTEINRSATGFNQQTEGSAV